MGGNQSERRSVACEQKCSSTHFRYGEIRSYIGASIQIVIAVSFFFPRNYIKKLGEQSVRQVCHIATHRVLVPN